MRNSRRLHDTMFVLPRVTPTGHEDLLARADLPIVSPAVASGRFRPRSDHCSRRSLVLIERPKRYLARHAISQVRRMELHRPVFEDCLRAASIRALDNSPTIVFFVEPFNGKFYAFLLEPGRSLAVVQFDRPAEDLMVTTWPRDYRVAAIA